VRTLTENRVAGLHVTEWRGGGPTVLCLPGLGSSGRVWTGLATALPEARVLAPDLRGRGGSSGMGGPTGLRAHARDAAALVEELDLHDVVLVGHSMGAFLAPVAAKELGDRVARLVLVDGGVPPRLPFFMGPGLTGRVFRRDLQRLNRAWPDARAFTVAAAGKALRGHPELLDEIALWAAHDLAGPAGAQRPRLDLDRCVADAVDTFFGSDVVPALEALRVPAHLLTASSGKHDRARPFLPDRVVQEWTARLPLLTAERVDANHLTILFSRELREVVAR
jgi:lipase